MSVAFNVEIEDEIIEKLLLINSPSSSTDFNLSSIFKYHNIRGLRSSTRFVLFSSVRRKNAREHSMPPAPWQLVSR